MNGNTELIDIDRRFRNCIGVSGGIVDRIRYGNGNGNGNRLVPFFTEPKGLYIRLYTL